MRVDIKAWPRKRGEEYVQKFREMEVSAAHLDNSDSDSNPAVDQVRFESRFTSAEIGLNGDTTVALTRGKVGAGSYKRTEMTSTDGILHVTEREYKEVHDDEDYPGKDWDNTLLASDTWERSFRVQESSGIIIADTPGLEDWFSTPS